MTCRRTAARGRRCLASTIMPLLVIGCSPADRPPLGRVTGLVRLDGQPLAHATVHFTPAGPGRTSQGTTDPAGRYELLYLRNIPGADIDHHRVRITTASDANGGRELLPPRYNTRSELEATVVAGMNDLPFDLRSAAR